MEEAFSWRNRGVISALMFTGGGILAIVGGVASFIHCPGYAFAFPCAPGESVIGKEADNIAKQLSFLFFPGVATMIIAFLILRDLVLRQSRLDVDNGQT